MTNETQQDILAEMDDILEAERQALLKGELESLDALMLRKESLIDRLNEIDMCSDRGLDALQSKAMRNQALLDSALEGIRDVARRIAFLRQARKSLDTYDAHGKKLSISAAARNRVEKRA